MKTEAEALLEVGTVVGTHGLRGDLKVRMMSGDPEILNGVKQVRLCLASGAAKTLEIKRRVLHKGQLLLRFAGYDSINQVEEFIGARLMIGEEQLPDLGEGEYYWGQLQGLRVIDAQHGDIGQLDGLLTTAAHDTYVVNGPCGEVLVPAVKQFVQKIDLDSRVMHVDLPEGLVPAENDDF